jgi:hypothetical protein
MNKYFFELDKNKNLFQIPTGFKKFEKLIFVFNDFID